MKSKIVVLKIRPELLRTVPATPTHKRIEKKKPSKKKQSALALDGAASTSVPSTPSGNHSAGAATAGGESTPKSKPGANAGNIGIKALDRSGKPCRRWVKGTVELASFTGFKYDVCSWTSPA